MKTVAHLVRSISPKPRQRLVRAAITGLLLLGAGFATSGCIAIGVGLGAGAVVAHVEERGLGGAVADAEIKVAIMDRWLREDYKLLGDLGLMIYGGRVLVTGTAPDEETRARAIELARQPRGIEVVIDEVIVGPNRNLPTIASDQIITKKLQTLMLFDSDVRSINYHRRTFDGTIYVIGVAQDMAERSRVVDMARTISGVREVVDHIVLPDRIVAATHRPNSPEIGSAFGSATALATPPPSRLESIPLGATGATAPGAAATPLPDLGATSFSIPGPAMPADGAPIPLTAPSLSTSTALDAGRNPVDAEISLSIAELWYSSDPGLAARLGLLVHDGRVVLTGLVPDESTRVAPYGLAWQVEHVREVYNDIRVGPDPAPEILARDRLIENRLVAELKADPSIDAADYVVRADAGQVHLLGDAASAAELSRIEALARALDGVDRVVSHVAVPAAVGTAPSTN
ncbi:MAG: BON domain-containing protein [Alphaproteobacteria bacterium]|nr:BON domain-containing protein [Alphaproteobacteria bacterium]